MYSSTPTERKGTSVGTASRRVPASTVLRQFDHVLLTLLMSHVGASPTILVSSNIPRHDHHSGNNDHIRRPGDHQNGAQRARWQCWSVIRVDGCGILTHMLMISQRCAGIQQRYRGAASWGSRRRRSRLALVSMDRVIRIPAQS